MYRFYFNCHHWRPSYDQWIYANRCLSINEIKRIDQYKYQRDVKYSLIGQLLIRYLLSRVFHKPSCSFVIHRNEFDRPYVDRNPSFDFNLSHANQLVCIAGTFHGKLGCDTMMYERRENYELFRKKFTINEMNLIEKNPKIFYRLWALKESYVKWLGSGISGYQFSKLNFQIYTEEFQGNNIISNTTLENDNQIRFDEEIINLSDKQQQIITLCLLIKNACQSFVELNIDDILHGSTPFDKNKQDDLISWERFQMKRQTDI